VPPDASRADASGGGLSTDGATVYVSTGYGRLVALDAATGSPRWTQDLDAPGSSSPTDPGRPRLLVARDSRAWALEAATGRIRWQVQGLPLDRHLRRRRGGRGPATSSSCPTLGRGPGRLPARRPRPLDHRGRRAPPGSAAAFAATDIGGDPVIAGDTVYVGNVSGRTAALDLGTARRCWSIAEGAVSPVWPAGDSVFLVNDLGRAPSRRRRQRRRDLAPRLPRAERRRGVTAFHGPVLAGGRLIVGSSDNGVLQVDPARARSWGTCPLPSGAASAPVVAGQTLYVVTEDGRLNAFR
jgi:outer membrane protein assembly factor BamB